MVDLFPGGTSPTVAYAGRMLFLLLLSGLLGAALGVVRPVRTEIVPRSAHVVQAQILLAIVGAMIMIIVAESLARAFAIVGAAGLVRYRARIQDPKDAGVMLVSLAVGLATGSGLLLFAVLGTVFVIGVLWLLESLEPPARSRFDLTISTKHPEQLRPEIEVALRHNRVAYELRGSSRSELHYEVVVPFGQNIRRLSKVIKNVDGRHGTTVEWDIKKYKTLST